MTLHTKRRKRPAKGYTKPHRGNGGTMGLMVRVHPEDFLAMRKLALDAQVPMSLVIRQAVSRFLKYKGLKA